jgi:hypothetical protein
MGDGGERKVILALEVVEEAAFGNSGFAADIVDSCCGVALGADKVQRGVKQPGLGVVLGGDFDLDL